MMGLTPRQADCAKAIAELNDSLGRPPMYRELAKHLGLAGKANAFFLVKRLRERRVAASRRIALIRELPGGRRFTITRRGNGAARTESVRFIPVEELPA